MVEDRNKYLAERMDEYHLRVPKIPRQSVEVFGRDVGNGDYGLSVGRINVLLSYVRLQQTLASFDDLTFSPEFLDRLTADFRGKLGDNIFSGIALADLEIPTTDKILLARMLAADCLTETLSQAPVEVWVTPQIQKDLGEPGLTTDTGLQQIDYGQLSLRAKLELVGVMEHQEAQVHTILAARQHFPEGVLPMGFSALLSGQRERIMFNTLTDLESQYKTARQALDNPLVAWLSGAMEKRGKEQTGSATQEPREETELEDSRDQLPINIEEEAKGEWWDPDKTYNNASYARYRDAFEKIAEYLRPQYANRSIYEILDAETDEAQEEVLAAFWRTGQSRRIDFGDESFLFYDLYLNSDGVLELHFHNEAFGDRKNSIVTGPLTSNEDVAMVDQAIKWIQSEMLEMQKMREQWERSGFDQTPLVEVTLATALGLDRTAAVREGIDGLPKWFVEALNQEAR